ncbi:MAG: nucleotidyltransferase family protein [Clostridia bacterium]|nr:nucleotidyltransferase family protein [Clostridia bacterium]
MKIAVIICEYNPLQNGHVYHISRALKECGNSVICIMSGNFTQRGQLAIADKYKRAEWAIKSGADMVVELPPQYVLTTAKYFALGGVKIANKIKGEVTLTFGSELGDIKTLQDIANFQEDEVFATNLDKELKLGNGYAKSYANALAKTHPAYAQVISSPNNILAVEYLKALNDTQSIITPHTVARIGGGYHQTSADEYPSASCVRQMWQNSDLQAISQGVPLYVMDYLKALSPTHLQVANDKLYSILKYNIGSMDLTTVHGVKEGIENRIVATLKSSVSWQEMLDKLSTKRYTDAYLLRTLINILISNTYTAGDLQNDVVDYVNVLAVEKTKRQLLSCFDCQVITKSIELQYDSLIKRADSIYASVTENIPDYMQIITK